MFKILFKSMLHPLIPKILIMHSFFFTLYEKQTNYKNQKYK